ncbi:hypothetical protein PS662_01618 [Pseudomonas fluorescens]|uniref:Uncharacterized protein n=1 Tax=Pseudomonas fluorescens TaxID=294 RepID=A0A5E6RHR1_PSEFL|nr:hypothetical protein PS662_01618 [Pseudomonas fluorescens]
MTRAISKCFGLVSKEQDLLQAISNIGLADSQRRLPCNGEEHGRPNLGTYAGIREEIGSSVKLVQSVICDEGSLIHYWPHSKMIKP